LENDSPVRVPDKAGHGHVRDWLTVQTARTFSV
jgi:hypothetical protein